MSRVMVFSSGNQECLAQQIEDYFITSRSDTMQPITIKKGGEHTKRGRHYPISLHLAIPFNHKFYKLFPHHIFGWKSPTFLWIGAQCENFVY